MYLSLAVIFGRPEFDFIPLKASGLIPNNLSLFLSLSPRLHLYPTLTYLRFGS
jgi:hypothetical protein